MDIIDELVVDDNINLSSIDDLDTSTLSMSFTQPLPVSATTNQSAVLAALSGQGANVVDNFQRLQQEAAMGDTTFRDQTLQLAQELTREAAFKQGVLPILYDPLADIESKQKVLNDYRQAVQSPDSLTMLATEALIAGSEGETPDAEEARISLSDDLFANFQESMKIQQQLVNNFKLDIAKNATAVGTTADIAQEVIVPMAEGIKAYRFVTELNDKLGKSVVFEKKAKALLRPGATIQEYRDMYAGLSDNDRIEFVKVVLDTIKETNGVIFSADSQFAAVSMLEKIVGDYSNAEASWDTLSNALDIFGVGLGLRAAGRSVKAARDAKKLAEDVIEEAPTPSTAGGQMGVQDVPRDLRARVSNPEKDKIPELLNKKTELLAESSGILPNRSVTALNEELAQIMESLRTAKDSFKEEVKNLQIRKQMSRKEAESAVRSMQKDATIDLEARKKRVEGLLEQNRKAQKAQDQIKGIEDEIERLTYLPDIETTLRVNPIIDGINRIERNSLTHVENPASVGSIFYRTNPEKSRTAVKLVFESQGDEVAQALFGMTRQDVLADALTPKILTPSGKVPAKPVNLLRDIEKPETALISRLKEAVAEKDAVELTPREKAAGASKITNDFKSPTKIKVVDGMDGFKVNHESGKIQISSIYGNEGGAFSDAQDAIDQVKLALRDYGDMTPYITLMKKDGVDYSPVNLKDVKGVKGDYLVRLEFEKMIERGDVKATGPLDEFKVKWNLLDAIPQFVSEKTGTLTRHILTAGAIFDKHLTTAANVADSLTSRLEKILQRQVAGIVSDIKKLPAAQQDKLINYFVEANEKGIALTKTDLVNRGFSVRMQQIAKNWREYWDSVYYLENADMAKTLRNQGYQLLDNGTDRFFARPINKNIREAKGYDPETGKIVVLNRQEMDELYEKGGTIAQLKSSFQVDGDEVANIIVKNNSRNYLRGIDESDKVLNYREGYYLTSYRAPLFIDKVDRKTGKRTAIATAKDSREAALFIKRKQQSDPDFDYISRPDKKKQADQKEDVWNLNNEGGRTSQRRRGKPLVEADGSNRLEGTAYFDSPVESAIRASRSIAGRTMYRDIIETAKDRAMQKHGHLFPKENGVPKFPSKISDIASPSGKFGKDVRDARTDFEYIHYLENGYINGTDSLFKSVAGVFAEGIGSVATKLDSKALAAVERGARRLEETPFSGLGKAVVFNSYIATNILRQWIVQPAQVLRLAAYDPTGLPGTIQLTAEYTSFLVSGKALTKKGQGFVDFMEKTGILDSVDKSNLVRGTLMTSGEQANWWSKSFGRVTEYMRVAGYDVGEKANLIGHMAAVYNKYEREGKAVTTAAMRNEMLGKVRALSYDMGFAGDMPYNQNFLSVFVQFMQVPHKAVMQGFDRRLTAGERARMVTGDMLLYGAMGSVIVAAANALFGEEFLDENPEVKQFIVEGAMQRGANIILNNAISGFGGDVGRDLDLRGSLSPFDFGGYGKMAEALLTDGGYLDALSNTPAGGLLFKEGNRVQKAIMSVGRLVGYLPDSELTPQTVMGTLNDIAKITSGWNNIQKAIVANEMDKILSNTGQVLVDGISTKEAIALAFGIPPVDIAKFYESSIYLSETEKSYEDSVVQAARTAIQVAVGRTHLGLDNPETLEIVNAILMKSYRGSPKALEIINREMRFALQDPQINLQEKAVKHMSLPEMETDKEKLKQIIPEDKWSIYEKWSSDIDSSLKQLTTEE